MNPYPDPKVRTLELQDFLDNPAGSLDLASRYFGHVPDAAEIQRMVDPQVMGINAKDPSAPYDAAQRRAEMDLLRNRHDRELRDAMAWLEPWARELQLPQFVHGLRLASG
jgi:hypothetical protein